MEENPLRSIARLTRMSSSSVNFVVNVFMLFLWGRFALLEAVGSPVWF